mgnify:CR=1 FL=1|jgi:hypothetical protein
MPADDRPAAPTVSADIRFLGLHGHSRCTATGAPGPTETLLQNMAPAAFRQRL